MTNEFKGIFEKIKNNDPKLTAAVLDNMKLTNENVKYLFEAMRGNTHCKSLSIKGNQFDEKCVEFLCNMIRGNKTLERYFLLVYF